MGGNATGQRFLALIKLLPSSGSDVSILARHPLVRVSVFPKSFVMHVA